MTLPIPSVFVVDDDSSVRRSLARLFKSAGLPVELFASAEEFLEGVAPERAGCVVLDVQMPGVDGMALQSRLRNAGYALPIVFLTGHGTIPMSVQAMKDGAIDFLTKPVDDDDLLTAVRRALERDRQDRVEREEGAAIQERIEELTPREYEILTYVLTGLLNKQIAHALDISEKTVKVHRGRVMEKLGVTSVAELVRLAGRAGVKPAEDGPDQTFG
jgi:two-component system response regulator FixJ